MSGKNSDANKGSDAGRLNEGGLSPSRYASSSPARFTPYHFNLIIFGI